MKDLHIAVLGATGAVGQEMIRILEESDIPGIDLIPLAGSSRPGRRISFRGSSLLVQSAEEQGFAGANYVLGATDAEVSHALAPAIREAGAVFIDNSSAFRMDASVPLVIPEINGEDAFRHQGILANPNCSTIITLMAVAGIYRLSPIRTMVVSTYQAVSGAGSAGLRELEKELRQTLGGETITPSVFPAPIAMNVIPWIGSAAEGGYTDEELKMQREGRRILHDEALCVSCTCVRVPVARSHAISVTLQTEEKLSLENVRHAIDSFPGCRLWEGNEGACPTPLDAAGQDAVLVGRLRETPALENGLSLWCCGDQLRKGAAANAVQILRLLTENS